jgi:L-malate glycosyltransferase
MHNLTKIKIFRVALWITYPFACLFIYPFALVKKKNPSKLFFFFDRYSIGGAQRVHLDILESVQDIFKVVYFTRESVDKSLKDQFFSLPNTESHDVHFWCDNLIFRLFSVHFFAFYINRHRGATAFSSNSTFYYDVLPFFSRHISKIELLHNFTYGKRGMEFFGLANYKFLDKRLVIDAYTEQKIQEQYREKNLAALYSQRVQLVEFGVAVPTELKKDFQPPLKILNAGRGGAQKRIWLVNQIAEHMIHDASAVEFHFAGPMTSELSELVKKNSVVYNEIKEKEKLNTVYQACHVILLTSSFEGFPMVIKESMAYGCIPIVTALPGNKTHLGTGYNALLIDEIENEELVVEQAIKNIQALMKNHELLKLLSTNAYEYARNKFQKTYFLNTYRSLLTQTK